MPWSRSDKLVVLIAAGAPMILVLGLSQSLRHRLDGAAGAPVLPAVALAPPAPESVAAPAAPASPAEPAAEALAPPSDVDCRLAPSHASPVELTCRVTRVKDPRGSAAWRLDVQIANQTPAPVSGTIWVVATIRAADGRVERVASPAPLPFKAHTFTRKSFRLTLPEAARGTLTGVEAFVASGKSVVSFENQAH